MNRKAVATTRERLGLSTAEFAEKLGVTVSTVWRWETGRSKPQLRHVSTIKALGRLPTLQAVLVNPTTETVIAAAQDVEEALKERVLGNEAEKALLAATSEITAAWIAGHLKAVPAEAVLTFVHQLTRALRRE